MSKMSYLLSGALTKQVKVLNLVHEAITHSCTVAIAIANEAMPAQALSLGSACMQAKRKHDWATSAELQTHADYSTK